MLDLFVLAFKSAVFIWNFPKRYFLGLLTYNVDNPRLFIYVVHSETKV